MEIPLEYCLNDIIIDMVSAKCSPQSLMCVIRHELVAHFIYYEENEMIME